MRPWRIPLSPRRVAGLRVDDVALAGVLFVLAVASALARKPAEGPLWVTVPVAVVMTLALAGRTRAPLLTTVVVMIAAEVQTLVSISPGSLWALAVFLISAYTVAVACPEGRAAIGGSLVVGGLWLQEWHDHHTDYLFVIMVFGGAWLLGRAVRTWRSRAETAEARQDDKARLAVAEERLRIARELHDIVAHGLGVIAVQANAAEAALEHDPHMATAPLSAVKDSAHTALEDMRRLLGVLRRDSDDEVPHEPQPGMARLEPLIADFRRAGLRLGVDLEGATTALPPLIDLTVYRIVQEGLTNTLKHAGPVRARVRITVGKHVVRVEVANEPGVDGHAQPAGTGHGLEGIRERLSALGGRMVAGTGPDGFTLSAELPMPVPSR